MEDTFFGYQSVRTAKSFSPPCTHACGMPFLASLVTCFWERRSCALLSLSVMAGDSFHATSYGRLRSERSAQG